MTTSIVGLVAQPQSIAVLLFSTVLLALIHKRLSRHAGLPLPPGPPAESWIFGNSIPKALCVLWSFVTFIQTPNDQFSAYRKFETWTREYGPVFSLRQGFNTLIVVGRYHAAVEIMEKGGASTVDRPTSIAAGETLSGGMRVLLTPAGERFKKMRRYVFFPPFVGFVVSDDASCPGALDDFPLYHNLLWSYGRTCMIKIRFDSIAGFEPLAGLCSRF